MQITEEDRRAAKYTLTGSFNELHSLYLALKSFVDVAEGFSEDANVKDVVGRYQEPGGGDLFVVICNEDDRIPF